MKETIDIIRCRAALAVKPLEPHYGSGICRTHWRFTAMGKGPRRNRTMLFSSATVNALINAGEAIRQGDVVRSLVNYRKAKEGT